MYLSLKSYLACFMMPIHQATAEAIGLVVWLGLVPLSIERIESVFQFFKASCKIHFCFLFLFNNLSIIKI
ncbi:hypothetical protein AYI78_00585 [Shewanella algae]|nr:hypothetical protein AYI98_02555 [Shewanella algae]TVO87901.1 hypothetical protein AYI76_00585 [Shewanella algae]TVO89504.1 hypothetical protein AYI78_00585 [Shewanella algae]TVO99497.1 hypothetical protein AYI79_00585 [Shewanella algae]TVP07620.1 hypothetical protein AYI73_04940 [Shewanella algae]